MTPRVVMLSFWRNDASRQLTVRMEHLLAKTHPGLRWLWVVGDSADATEGLLRERAFSEQRLTVLRHDTGIYGDDTAPRMARLRDTANAGLDCVQALDDYVLIHESDLQSPPDVVERFLATGLCPIAGWVTLTKDSQELFYDTWAYAWANGVYLQNGTPRPNERCAMQSVGSCWMMHAEDVRAGVRCGGSPARDLCAGLRARGRAIWMDPSILVVQPEDLWRRA